MTAKEVALRQDMRKPLGGPRHVDAAGDHQPRRPGRPTPRRRSAGCCGTRPTSATRSSRSTARPPATRSPRELRSHILIAADVIAAAKAGDGGRRSPSAQARWTANADGIAAMLARANPRHWKPATMKRELRTHLTLTTEEVVARLHGDWNGDVAAYDKVHVHMLHFADLLSEGLVAQFPRRFR